MIKRGFDLLLSLLLLPLLGLAFLILSPVLLVRQGRPVLFFSERMKTVDQGFRLIKFRTMENQDDSTSGECATGAHNDHRITGIGRTLRRTGMDELPQLLNVLLGNMSLVGPRPPLRRHVQRHKTLYRQVLQNKPGITGLASVVFQQHEANLLSGTKTLEETERVYNARCVPRKAAIDLIYQRNQSLVLDLYVIYLTLARFLPLPGRRARRIHARKKGGRSCIRV